MIVIAGASGFVGGHLTDHLLSKGLPVKCLARSRESASRLKAKGAQVFDGDITAAQSLQGLLKPGDIVIHLVGIIEETRSASFRQVHLEGTRNLVAEAERAGAGHVLYQSALGADSSSWSGYLRTKAQAEEVVRQSGLGHTIFRPSLIVGPWDGFSKKILELLRQAPVIPLPGDGLAKFQPLAVSDWVRCAEMVIAAPENYSGTYDLGGPEHLTYRRIIELYSRAAGSRKPVFSIPMGLMKLGTRMLERFLPTPPVSSDQLRLLEQDNIADLDAVFDRFGFQPITLAQALKEFVG